MFLDLADREVAVVPARCGEDGVGATLGERLREVRRLAGAAGGDHRHRDGIGDRAQQVEVVALAGAVAVHRRQQHLAGAVPGRGLRGPLDGVTSGRRVSRVDVDLPSAVASLRVDRDHHALRAEPVGTA